MRELGEGQSRCTASIYRGSPWPGLPRYLRPPDEPDPKLGMMLLSPIRECRKRRL
jgi:hypothetical protein